MDDGPGFGAALAARSIVGVSIARRVLTWLRDGAR